MRVFFSPLRAAVAAALALFVAIGSAEACPPTGPASSSADADAKLKLAQAHAAAKRFEEAAKAFRDVALRDAGTDAGRSAVRPYFDAVNALATRAENPRPAAFDEAARDLPELVRLYCDCGAVRDHPEPCLTILLIRKDFSTIHADSSSLRPSPEALVGRAEANLAVWNDGGAVLCQTRQPGCAAMAPLLRDAAAAYEEAGKRIKALIVRKTMVEPRFGLDKTDIAAEALEAIGRAYEDFGAFDMAVDWYERLAKEIPAARGAPRALERAIDLRLKLGDASAASRQAELFEQRYGATQRSALGRIALRLARAASGDGAPQDIINRIDKIIDRIDSGASLDVRILAHAKLGEVAAELGDLRRAAIEFNRVEQAWKDPAKAVEVVSHHEWMDKSPDAILAAVLTAVGQAKYFRAEQARDRADRLVMPAYKGPDTKEGILAFVNASISPWMKKKREAIEAASDLYEAVLRVEPVSAPKWIVASAARVAFLWANFVTEMSNMPRPPEWRRTGPIPGAGGLTYEQLRAAYQGSIQSAAEPFMARAKEAFKFCVSSSMRNLYFDENSRACELWLSKTYPAEFHAVTELYRAPELASSWAPARPATPE